jgi:hypothetical protein
MTNRGKRAFLVGSVLAISLCLSVGCSSTTAAGGPDSPTGSGKSQKGKKAKRGGGDVSTDGGDSAPAELPDLPLPKPGVQGEENRSMGAKMSFTLQDESGAAAGLLDKGWSVAEDRRVMVEKVGETAVTQYSILYGERKTSGLDSWTKQPTEGKGYTVARKEGSLTVLDNGKQPASAEERKVVEGEYGFIGKANPLQLALEQAKDGEAHALDPDAYRFLLGHVPEITIEKVTIVLTGPTEVDGRPAHELEVNVTGKIPDGDITYAFDISGPGVVDETTAWPTALTLEGSLEITGKVTVKGKQMKAAGKGSLKLERTAKIK